MRLTTVILIASLMQVSAAGFAQKFSLTTTKESLKNVFAEIQKQTGFSVLAKSEYLNNSKPVTISIKNIPLEEALAKILAGQNLSFTIEDKVVLIKEKEPSFLDKLTSVFADTDVRGRVVDEQGNPLPNASIRVKGKDAATNTDEKGEFVIKSVADDAVLVISYVGYKQLELSVKGAVMPLEVKLNQVTGELEEVKVIYNTGFQLVDKTRTTGSFVQIDNKLLNRQIGSNIIDRLEGVTNGLLFDRRDRGNGERKNNLQIRGFYSLNENVGKPLIVLDNFPYNGDINNINPNDIESVTILRDAASASIWGAKAGNGVIVLTSKKGKFNQATRVSTNFNVSVQGKPRLFDLPILGPSDDIDLESFYFSKGTYDGNINGFLKPALTPLVEILLKQRNGNLSEKNATTQINQLRAQDVRNDFLKYFYRPTIGQRYSTSISGGSNNYNYIVNLGYDRNQSELVGNETNRITVGFNNTFKPLKNLEVQAGINYTPFKTQNNSTGGFGHTLYNLSHNTPLPLYSRFVDDLGNSLAVPHGYRASFTDTLKRGQLLDWQFKPLEELKLKKDLSDGQALLATFGIDYKILYPLSLSFRYQYQKNTENAKYFTDLNSYFMRSLINEFTNLNSSDLSKRYPVPVGGSLKMADTQMESHGLRGQVNYNQNLGQFHELSGLAGFSLNQDHTTSNGYTQYGYTNQLNQTNIDAVNFYPTIFGSMRLPTGSIPSTETLNRLVSFYSNLSYVYRNKYTVTGSVRRDASNLFGVETKKKWKPLWSIGLMWDVKTELLKKFEFFSNLNLRGTYGYQGNINNTLSAYNVFRYAPASENDALVNLPSANLLSLGNPSLKWEEVNALNLALDFATKNQILSGSIEYYKKNSKDVITLEQTDITTGYSFQNRNSANIHGDGINITLNASILNNKNFGWNSTFNYGSAEYKVGKVNNRRIESLATTTYYNSGIDIQVLEGYNPYTVFSLKWAGLDPQTGDPLGMLNGKITKNYDSLMYYTPFSEVVKHGSGVPEIYGNFLNNIRYKNLNLSLNIVYQLKYFVQKNAISYQALAYGNKHSDYLKRWQKTGDEQYTNVPSFVYPDVSNRDDFYRNSEANIISGDHIRLNDLRLSYTLKKVGSYKFKDLNFYSNIGNLNIVLWKKNKDGIDPSYPNGNISARQISFGFSAGF